MRCVGNVTGMWSPQRPPREATRPMGRPFDWTPLTLYVRVVPIRRRPSYVKASYTISSMPSRHMSSALCKHDIPYGDLATRARGHTKKPLSPKGPSRACSFGWAGRRWGSKQRWVLGFPTYPRQGHCRRVPDRAMASSSVAPLWLGHSQLMRSTWDETSPGLSSALHTPSSRNPTQLITPLPLHAQPNTAKPHASLTRPLGPPAGGGRGRLRAGRERTGRQQQPQG